MTYKNLVNPTISSLFHDLEVREIDTGFLNNNFEEKYQYLKNLTNDRITIDVHEIKSCLKELKNSESPIQLKLFAIFNFYNLLIKSPFQVISLMKPKNFLVLLDFSLHDETQYYVLHSLCYLIQAIQQVPDFIQILFEFNFFKHLFEIMQNTNENSIINLCLFISIQSLKLGDDVQIAVVISGLLQAAQSIDSKEHETNVLIARLFESVFSIPNEDFINLIINVHIQFFTSLALYGNFHEVKYHGLNGFIKLFDNFPDRTLILSSDNSVFIISENLANSDQVIRIYSSHILLQCASYSYFPLLKFYEYNVVHSMLCTFQWCDEELCLSCIEIMKALIRRDDAQLIQQIIKEISKTDLFTHVEPLSFIVKEGLTTFFEELIKRLNASQVEYVMNEQMMKFLLDFISIGQINHVNIISSIFINALNKIPNKNKLMLTLKVNDILEILTNVIYDDEVEGNDINCIQVLISLIQQF